MPEIAQPVLLLHVLSAFMWVAGYAATNLLTEFARRTNDPAYRRAALTFSGRFDRALNAPGGTTVVFTGLLAVWAFGYSLLAPWILASIVLYLAILLLGILYWRRFGGRVDAALAAGNEATVTRLMHAPRSIAVSRLENLMMLSIIALMVLRPGS